MKAEHRHKLETNTLADKLGHLVEGARQGLSRKTMLILSVLALVIILFYTWRHFAARSAMRNANLWLKWDQLDDPVKVEEEAANLAAERLKQANSSLVGLKELAEMSGLEKFARDNPGTIQGRAASFELARLALYDGLRNLGNINTRAEAVERLKKAAETYDKLIGESRDTPYLQQEALLNGAKANESLGKFDEAANLYDRLAKEYPKTEYGKTAVKELQRLKDTREQLDILARDLQPPERPRPLLPPGHPPIPDRETDKKP